MKTYTVTRRTPDAVLGMTTETLTVKSYDDGDEASTEILAQLGYAVEPCCYAEDEPCAECMADLRHEADMRAEDLGLDAARAAEAAGDAQDRADHERECREGQ